MLRERVDDRCRQRRVRKPVRHVDQPAVADRRHSRCDRKASIAFDCAAVSSARRRAEFASDDVNSACNAPGASASRRINELASAVAAERRLVPEPKLVQRAARQRAALQDVVLRLVVVGLRLILFDDLLEVDDVLLLGLDEQPCPRLEDRASP